MEDQWSVPGAQPPPEETPRRRHGRDMLLVLTGVVLVLLIWFAVVNLQRVRIHFWLTTTAAPLIVVIVISGVLGAAVSGLWSRHRRRRSGGADSGGADSGGADRP